MVVVSQATVVQDEDVQPGELLQRSEVEVRPREAEVHRGQDRSDREATQKPEAVLRDVGFSLACWNRAWLNSLSLQTGQLNKLK